MWSATLSHPWELPLLLALLLTAAVFTPSAHAAGGQELFALDGFGRPVAWWAVLKLPMHVRAVDADDSDGENKRHVRPTPCDCAAPDCANAPTASLNVDARATGLCYLYADANHPEFQHFRALGYDCLGQGGNDPVSHTLRQLRPAAAQSSEQEQEPYWAIFNDQLNGIARDYKPSTPSPITAPPVQQQVQQHGRSGAICSGGNLFSAHAKGAVGFRADSGGFFLQTSTPNFPDPTPVTASASASNTSNDGKDDAVPFVRLGCQVDNNVQFAQHLFAMSLNMEQLETLGTQLQVARLCSGNFYTSGSMDGLKELLASQALYADGRNASANGNFSGLYDALLNPLLLEREQSATLNLTLKRTPTTKKHNTHKNKRSSVYVESSGPSLSLADLNSELQHEDAVRQYGPHVEEDDDDPEMVHVIVKSPKAAVPPWALVAESLGTDISVASWWDGSYGIPNICAGDDYSRTSNQFCLADDAHDVHLVSADGTARFNIENLVQATWKLSNDSLTWHLIGGQEPDGNHAKWALTSPRGGMLESDSAFVTFADLNMEGFPCSSTCNGSQAGRGGSFFSLPNAELHASVAKSIVSKACRCTSASGRNSKSTSAFTFWDPETNTNSGRNKTPSHHEKRDARRSHGGDEAETTGDEKEARDDSNTESFVDARMCHFGCWRKVEARFTPEELPRLSPNASSYWAE